MIWVKRFLIGIIAIAVLSVVLIYIAGEITINKKYDSEPRQVMLSGRPDVVAAGERLARVYGCYEGCHGKDMEGQVFFEESMIGRITTSNLTTAMDKYSTSELEAIIRQAVRPDGTSVIGMPSSAFSRMTDNELAAILSFIKTYPKQDNEIEASSYYLMARLGLVVGEYPVEAAQDLETPHNNADMSDPMVRGEYLAHMTCGECHGLQLEGGFGPDLVIAKGYDADAFRTLMSTGMGIGDRDLGVMTQVSLKRFAHLTPDEVNALHAYLHSR